MTSDPLTVVLVHRGRPATCLEAVAAFRAGGVPVRVVVVDNGSAAADLDRLRAGLPEAEVLALGFNRGFGPAANVALRRWLDAGAGEWAVVAPDDAMPEPGCLATLLEAVSARDTVGMASAEFGPGHDYAPRVDRVLGPYNEVRARGAGFEPADFGHGTLLALRRRCLETVGLFDEGYFAYCEEADLGLRARRAGFEVGIVWGAVVRNGAPSFTVVTEYLKTRNTLRLVREHSGPGPARTRLAFACMSLVANTLRRRVPIATAQRHAIADYRRRRFGPPPAVLAGR